MSHYDYKRAVQLIVADEPYYAFIMAAMMKADDVNLPKLKALWPHIWDEVNARFNASGGRLPGECGICHARFTPDNIDCGGDCQRCVDHAEQLSKS